MKKWKKVILWILGLTVLLVLILQLMSIRPIPEEVNYGASFSKFHSDELGLDWKEVFEASLTDMGIRDFRFSAHWPGVEPEDDQFSFEVLDYQMERAKETGSTVILAVGRRLPGWPECHVPNWAQDLGEEELKKEILEYIEKVVTRYKDHPSVLYWQVENEAFLTTFATEHCGSDLDVSFLEAEIALVKNIDPKTPVMLTDSGELGRWYSAYKRGDAFGTTMYLYIWNHKIGKFRYPIMPGFFRFKQNIVNLFAGPKPTYLIELGVEPWLLTPIASAPIELQKERMGLDKIKTMIRYGKEGGFAYQYVWGVEWWYWMKQNGDNSFWEFGKNLFKQKE